MVASKIKGGCGQPSRFGVRLLKKGLFVLVGASLDPLFDKKYSMDLNVKYIPYVLRKAPALEQELPLRAFVDDKKSYFFFKRVFDIAASFLFIVFVLSWLLPVIGALRSMLLPLTA